MSLKVEAFSFLSSCYSSTCDPCERVNYYLFICNLFVFCCILCLSTCNPCKRGRCQFDHTQFHWIKPFTSSLCVLAHMSYLLIFSMHFSNVCPDLFFSAQTFCFLTLLRFFQVSGHVETMAQGSRPVLARMEG